MSITIEQANEAKRQLLAQNDGIKGLPLIKSATIVLGDEGFRIEAERNHMYKWLPPDEINGVPIKWR